MDDDEHHELLDIGHHDGGHHVGADHPPPPKERRFKLSRACDRCRRRRIKCDEGHPCQSCITANSSCTFEETGKRSHPHKSKRTVSLEDRMQHLESLIHAIPSNIFVPGSTSSSGSPVPPHKYPLGVPPPSLTTFPLANPSMHFARTFDAAEREKERERELADLADATSKLTLTHSYLYLDDQGSTRWQGESSGLPLLDVLLEEDRLVRHSRTTTMQSTALPADSSDELNPGAVWRAVTAVVPPDLMDNLVQVYLSTCHYLYPFLHIPSFLADYSSPAMWSSPGFASFVLAICCLASRHTDDPRVRADPADPLSAGTHFLELFHRLRSSSGVPGIDRPSLYSIQAALQAAVYCIGLGRLSRGAALLSEAITLSVDVGLHRSTEQYDDGWFDAKELESRKRTFWAVYCWDKQLAAAFGRPPMLRLRDCDVGPPSAVGEDFTTGDMPQGLPSPAEAFLYVTRIYVVLEGVLSSVAPLAGHEDPFLQRAAGVLVGDAHGNAHTHNHSAHSTPSADSTPPPPPPEFEPESARSTSPQRPTHTTATHMLMAEEMLLDHILGSIPTHWAPSAETLGSPDVLRVTQATRVLCMERFVRMLIHRHRLGVCVAKRALDRQARDVPKPRTSSFGATNFNGFGGFGASTSLARSASASSYSADVEREAIRGCHAAAVGLVAAHLSVASKGLMTYYGVHVIHQLTQAGRSLLAVLLECQHFINASSDADSGHTHPPAPAPHHDEAFYRSLIPPAVDALRSCLGLLRRFSGRYVCGLRSADLIEECCRRTRIPLDVGHGTGKDNELSRSRRPWLRPVRKKTSGRSGSATRGASEEAVGRSPDSGGQVSNTTPPTRKSHIMQSQPVQPNPLLGMVGAGMSSLVGLGAMSSIPNPPNPPPNRTPNNASPFLVGTPHIPLPGSGLDVMEYGMLDGGMGIDMGQLDLLAMLEYASNGPGASPTSPLGPSFANGGLINPVDATFSGQGAAFGSGGAAGANSGGFGNGMLGSQQGGALGGFNFGPVPDHGHPDAQMSMDGVLNSFR
ncbi:fungal-specific transcription factor domain-containing protein [Auriculariales sp. MPI-PUGE-AT-0066]|nr:fungal-specific transcription factor domain-containing protein [Auriculariales sp. MPI-PUGE-AT-0066]